MTYKATRTWYYVSIALFVLGLIEIGTRQIMSDKGDLGILTSAVGFVFGSFLPIGVTAVIMVTVKIILNLSLLWLIIGLSMRRGLKKTPTKQPLSITEVPEEIKKNWKTYNLIFWGATLAPIILYILIQDSDYIAFLILISIATTLLASTHYAFVFSRRQISQLFTFLLGLLFPLLGYFLVWDYRNKALKQ